MVTAPSKDHGPQELEPMPKDDSQLRKLDDLEFRDHWTCLLQSQEPSVQNELKDIMAILENAGDKGATPHQIKVKKKKECQSISPITHSFMIE